MDQMERMKPARIFHETVGRGISGIREVFAAKKLLIVEPGNHFPLMHVDYIGQLAGSDRKKIRTFYGDIDDIEASRRFGAKDLEEFSYWAWRSCGIVGVQMVIEAVQGENLKQSTMDYVREGLDLHGYQTEGDKGWFHECLKQIAIKHGIPAETKKFISSSEIASLVNQQNFVLASVKSSTGGHFLLIYGFRIGEDKKLEGFWLHDPNDYEKKGKALFMSKGDFDKISSRRIVAFAPLP